MSLQAEKRLAPQDILQATNHPGIRTDGVWLYEWKNGEWVLASIKTVELYGHLVKNRAKYGGKQD